MSNEIVPIAPSQDMINHMENSGPKNIPLVTILNSRNGHLTEEGYEHIVAYMNQIVLIDNKKYSLIGKSFDCKYLAVRSQASEYKDGKFTTAFAQVNSGGNQELYDKFSLAAMNNKKGYKFGPEYLVFIPSIQKIAKIYFGDFKGREEAGRTILTGVTENPPCLGWTIWAHKHAGPSVKFPRMIFKAKKNEDPNLLNENPNLEDYEHALEQFFNPPNFDEPEDGERD